MNNMVGVLQEAVIVCTSPVPGFTLCIGGVGVAHLFVLFSVLCFFVLLVFVLCLVYPNLPVSLYCPFLIVRSVFSNA